MEHLLKATLPLACVLMQAAVYLSLYPVCLALRATRVLLGTAALARSLHDHVYAMTLPQVGSRASLKCYHPI